MGKIICLMGKSSTGKDTIFKEILKEKEPEINTLVPYTTRPLRDEETNGVEYFFTDEEGYRRMAEAGKIIEERNYNTYHGLWRYFTVDDGRIDLKHKNYAVIGTLEAYNKMCDFFGSEQVIPILIDVEDGMRLERAFTREKHQDTPKFDEMCRRYIADSQDFADDKIKAAGINRRFYNDNLERCLQEIKAYIKESIE